jgi:hypothetical protein
MVHPTALHEYHLPVSTHAATYLFPESESLHLLVRVAEGCVAVGRSPQVQVTQLHQVSPHNLPASQPLYTHARRKRGKGMKAEQH